MQSPNILKLIISNLTPQRAQQFAQKEYAKIQIDAGYQDNHAVIFSGDIKQTLIGRESPVETTTTVYASDTDMAHNYATVNTTLPPGSTPQQHFNTALQAMQPMGASQGFIGVNLSTPIYPRAVTLFGMARDVLANIAKFKQATVSYQNGQITMVQNGQSMPGSAIVLNTTTGLVGMPTQTIGGVFARCLINPSIKILSQVQINQNLINQEAVTPINNAGQEQLTQSLLPTLAADGLYTVYRIDIVGDTRGNPWYMDLQMLASGTNPAPNTPQTSLVPYLQSP